MENLLLKPFLFFSKSLTHRLIFLGGSSAFIYLIRYMLSRNVPSLKSKSARYTLSVRFFRQLFKLIPIVIPSFTCPEALSIYFLSLLLLLRSYLSIFVSNMNGKLLKSLVTINSQQFFRRVSYN